MRTATAEESLKFEVAHKIRSSIFSGEFKRGQPLRELALAKELLVSQAVVREALTHLEPLGLIRRVPNKGSFVTDPSREEMRDRLRMRILIEEIICLDAAARMTEEDFTEASKLIDAMQNLTQNDAKDELVQADATFHRFIWQKSGSPVLLRTVEHVSAPLYAFFANGDHAKDTNLHRQLLDAMKTKDETAIRKAVHTNLDHSLAL